MGETRKTDEEIRERIADLEQALADQQKENALVKTIDGAVVAVALETSIDELRWVLAV